MENYYQGQENNSEYRPYAGYTPSGYPVGTDIFAVSPQERTKIKKNYFGTFGAALIHTIGSFTVAQIMFIAVMLAGYAVRYTDDGTTIIDWQYSLVGGLAPILFCIGIFIFDKAKSKNSLSSYFEAEKITGKFVVGFFGVVLFTYAASMLAQNYMLIAMWSSGISPISAEYLTEQDITPAYLAVEVIFTVILAPIAEELMFRGVILRRLSTVSQRTAIFISAAIFGLMHGNLLQTFLGFCMGIVFGYAAVKTGSLILPIAGHMFVNAFATSENFVEYFLGEDVSNSYFSSALIMFLLIGLVCLVIVAISGGIKFPDYNDYHRKRSFPIMLTCVSFWILLACYLIDVISKFGPVTDKMLDMISE